MFLLTLACTGEPEVEAHFDDPSGPGTFSVVTEEHAFGDGKLQIWFPTSEPSGSLAEYDDLLEGIAVRGGPADCSQTRPVVVFTHGNGGIRWQSIFLTEQLASHGYVVVAPDHVGNTMFDLDAIPRSEVASTRPTDVAEAFDFAADALPDCVDEEAGYAVIGHSFGGWTSLAVTGATVDVAAFTASCEDDIPWLCGLEDYIEGDTGDFSDPRAWAAVPMTPVGSHDFAAGLSDQSTPILLLGGTGDTLTSMEEQVVPIFEGVGGDPAKLAEIEDTGHFTYSVMCALTAEANGCEDEFLSAVQAHPLINELTLSFLGQVRGFEVADPVLDGVIWH